MARVDVIKSFLVFLFQEFLFFFTNLMRLSKLQQGPNALSRVNMIPDLRPLLLSRL